MDIELLRTFLEVERMCHFGKAGDRLHITQSAVSARINLLEKTVGVPVFVRERNNLRLTPEGVLLKRHAETIVNSWARARQEVQLQPEFVSAVAIGATLDLWRVSLSARMAEVKDRLPETAFQIESHTSDVLIRKVLDGVLDVAVLFEPPQVPGLEIRDMGTIKLVLLSTRKGIGVAEALGDDYVLVDWGVAFGTSHAQYFPDMKAPSLRVNFGALGLDHILSYGGSAYLPESVIYDPVNKGKVFPVEGAPIIDRDVYAIFQSSSDRLDLIRDVLEQLKVS